VRIDPGIHATREVPRVSDFRDRERRANPRTNTAFVVTVRGIDSQGEPMNVDTELDNLSGSGMYVRIPRRVERGARLAVGIRFSEAGMSGRVPRVAARGVALRVEPILDGSFGLAIAFTKTRVF
jgi:PilZ domain